MPGNPDDILQTSSPLASYHAYRSEINAAIQRILDQPAYVLGPAVADFESGFSSYVGVPYGIGVNSGTDALHFALRAMGIGGAVAVWRAHGEKKR